MSGPMCPDCGGFELSRENDVGSCGFCGWKGPFPEMRVIPAPDMFQALAEPEEAIIEVSLSVLPPKNFGSSIFLPLVMK